MMRLVPVVMGIAVFMLLPVRAAPARACPGGAAAGFDAVLTATLEAVRAHDAPALLNQMSRDGVSFGADGPVVPFAVLERQFREHGGRFCDLFVCNGAEGPMHRLFVAGHMDRNVDETRGLASVFINANTNDELDLSYRFNVASCRWELTGIAIP